MPLELELRVPPADGRGVVVVDMGLPDGATSRCLRMVDLKKLKRDYTPWLERPQQIFREC
jgi:hypothetical protein